ncbi:MAG: hypothetical protein QXL35_04390 [Candidatus Bathyarchaeia archaeon]
MPRRAPSVFYSLAEPLEREGRALHWATADLPARLTVVARTGPSAADIYRESIKLNLINLVTTFLLTLCISLGGRGARGSGPEGPAQEGAEGGSFSEQRLEEAHARADELLDGIIRPWIHDLLDALEGIGEEGGAVLEEVAQPLLERASEAMGRVEKAFEALRPRGSPPKPVANRRGIVGPLQRRLGPLWIDALPSPSACPRSPLPPRFPPQKPHFRLISPKFPFL